MRIKDKSMLLIRNPFPVMVLKRNQGEHNMLKRIVAVLAFALLYTNCSTSNTIPTVSDRVAARTHASFINGQQTDQFLYKVFQETDTIYIRNGIGGDLQGMLRTLRWMRQHPDKLIVIDGPCYSACTLLLSLPNNVTYTERARFFFHSASIATLMPNGELRDQVISESGNIQMLEVLPKEISDWVLEVGAFESLEFTEMPIRSVYEVLPALFSHSNKLPKRAGDLKTSRK